MQTAEDVCEEAYKQADDPGRLKEWYGHAAMNPAIHDDAEGEPIFLKLTESTKSTKVRLAALAKFAPPLSRNVTVDKYAVSRAMLLHITLAEDLWYQDYLRILHPNGLLIPSVLALASNVNNTWLSLEKSQPACC